MNSLLTTTDGNEIPAETDVFAYLTMLWRHRRFLVWFFVGAVAVSAVLSWWVISPTYESTSLVLVGQGDLTLGSADAYRGILLSPQVRSAAVKASGARDKHIPSSLSVDVVPNSSVVKLVVESSSPAWAQTIAIAWYRSFKERLQDLWGERVDVQLAEQKARAVGIRQVMESSLEAVSQSSGQTAKYGRQIMWAGDLTTASGEVERLESVRARVLKGQLSDVAVIVPFTADSEPVAPNKKLNVAVAGFLAVMVGVIAVFVTEAWRTRKSLGMNADAD